MRSILGVSGYRTGFDWGYALLGCTIPILRGSFDVCLTVCGGVLWSVLLVVRLLFGFLGSSLGCVGVLVLVIRM